MIHVLYTVNGLRVNGMSAVIMQYIAGLDREKYSFFLFTDEVAQQYEEPLAQYGVKVIQSVNRKKNQAAYMKELCRILKNEKIDIIHIHGNSATIAVELMAAKLCRVPVRIAHSHNTTCQHKVFDRLLRPWMYGTYTHGIGCGKEAGKWLFGHRTHDVIKNGIDLEHFGYSEEARVAFRKKYHLEGKYVIGHVGRFTDQKNHDGILRIFQSVLKEKEATLLLVGDGPREAEVKALAKEMDLEEHIVFFGTTKDTAEVYSAMDVFLFPSKFEGVPLTLIEAQANGLPAVISDQISPEVVMTDLITVMPLTEEESWTEHLLAVEADRGEKSETAIRQLTKAGHNAEKVIETLDRLYTRAIKEKR